MEDNNKISENFLLDNEISKYIEQITISYIKSDNLIDQENIEDFICPICLNILNNPISCSDKKNSHSFCKNCIDKYLEQNDNCPTCKLKFGYKINEELYNTLVKLNFICEFKKEGCSKIIPYSDYLTHINNCKYYNKQFECLIMKYNYESKSFEKCGYLGNKIEIEIHFKKCAFINYKCLFCNKNIINMDLENHIKNECKYGLIKYSNDDIYIGEKNNNIKEGYGIMYYSDGDKYEGEFKNDLKDGYGVIYYSNGDKYEGEWKNGLKNGYGIYFYSNGDKYEGECKNGLKDGYGAFYYLNGDIYEGEFKNNYKDGYGIYYFSNNDKYEGKWKNGLRVGYGIYTFSEGDIYNGEFKNNNFDGFGIYYYSSGERYEGEWKNDEKNGFGIYKYPKGGKYEGEFKNGESDGYGIDILSNGNILECEFRNDKPNGYGIFYFNNGDKYEGKFKDGTNYGYGIFYSSLGFKYENYFKNGIYEKFLFNIYKIILFFHYLYSIIIKRKISAILFIFILIISYIL